MTGELRKGIGGVIQDSDYNDELESLNWVRKEARS